MARRHDAIARRSRTRTRSRLRAPLALLGALLIAGGGIVVAPQPAEAAARQSVAITSTVGEDRVVRGAQCEPGRSIGSVTGS